MRPLTKSEVGKFGNELELSGCTFLDEFKIGLTLADEGWVLPHTVNMAKPMRRRRLSRVNLRRQTLQPGRLYLGTSKEHFRLPHNVFGLLHTRSSYARHGIDCFGSSVYVSPGFGSDGAAPIVFELRVLSAVRNLPNFPMAGMVLFALDSNAVDLGRRGHSKRFPLGDE